MLADAIIRSNALFRNLNEEQLEQALCLLQAEEHLYEKGEILVQINQPLRKAGLVLSGAVQVARTDMNGQRMLMASVAPGESFGEALHWLNDPLRQCVYIEAAAPSRVLWLSLSALQQPGDQLASMLLSRLVALLAERALDMNDRIQILSQRSLRRKIIALLSQWVKRSNSNCFRVPMDRAAMADYLGCDRAALSRELSRMRADGLLDYDRNAFCLHPLATEEP